MKETLNNCKNFILILHYEKVIKKSLSSDVNLKIY